MTFLTDNFIARAREQAKMYWQSFDEFIADCNEIGDIEGTEHAIHVSVIKHVSNLNEKLGKDTWVFNTGSAVSCPSVKLGLCQAGAACYALKAERMYKSSLPYRERQALLWKSISADAFAAVLLQVNNKKRRKVTHFRYSESGDFSSQEHVNWLAQVCRRLTGAGIVCFGYTARTDLNLTELVKVSQVNASNEKHTYSQLTMNRFKMMLEISENETLPVCKCSLDKGASCADCGLCKEHTGIILVKKH